LYKIVYIGSDHFSAKILEALIDSGKIDVELVITYRDIQKGRGHAHVLTPVKTVALGHSLKTVGIETVSDVFNDDSFYTAEKNLGVLVSFKFVPQKFIAAFQKGIINLHPSLLPDLRGAAPVQRAIMNGYTQSGCTTFLLSEKIDCGNILLQEKFDIKFDETTGDIYDKIVALSSELIIKSVSGVADESVIPQNQKTGSFNSAHKIAQHDRRIDWSGSAVSIYNKIRALDPSPFADTTFGGKSVRIVKSVLSDIETDKSAGYIFKTNDKLFVACGKGTLEIVSLQMQGKPVFSAKQFLNGYVQNKIVKFD
jgi:methionyl-tRNA formyltransferase